VTLGGDTVVRRLLPNLGRRLVGAWCFVDHYGPDDVATGPGMRVPPHPHIGCRPSAGCSRARCTTATAWAVIS
jgi:redox-sensitive bicupin YhaK (pirin superfamily)